MKEYIVPIYDDSPNHDEIFVGYIREHATEIVRCKDCKYSDKFADEEADLSFPLKCLSIRYGGVRENWFCEHGEKVSE